MGGGDFLDGYGILLVFMLIPVVLHLIDYIKARIIRLKNWLSGGGSSSSSSQSSQQEPKGVAEGNGGSTGGYGVEQIKLNKLKAKKKNG